MRVLWTTTAGIVLACAPGPTVSPHVGATAPPLTLPGLVDPQRTVSLSPDGITVVDFWATWCAPCVRALPAYERVLRERNSVRFVGVNEDRGRDFPLRFLAHPTMSRVASSDQFQFAIDPGAAAARRYRVRGLPSLFVVDARGIVRSVHTGYHAGDADELADVLDQLLGGGPPGVP